MVLIEKQTQIKQIILEMVTTNSYEQKFRLCQKVERLLEAVKSNNYDTVHNY